MQIDFVTLIGGGGAKWSRSVSIKKDAILI